MGMLADQDVKELDGIFIPFFGKDTWTATAPAKIALASGAPILPIFIIRENDHYRVFIENPIRPILNGSKEESVRTITEAWSRIVEQYVRRFPDQWVWMHNRWKTRPQDVKVLETEGAKS